MECDFTEPVNYLGDTPTTNIEAFNFRHMSCSTPLATPSAQTSVATISGTVQIDTASTSALAIGIHDSMLFLWTTCALLLLIGSFFMGTYMFRK